MTSTECVQSRAIHDFFVILGIWMYLKAVQQQQEETDHTEKCSV